MDNNSAPFVPWSGVGGWGNPSIQISGGPAPVRQAPPPGSCTGPPPDHVPLIAPLNKRPSHDSLFNNPEFSDCIVASADGAAFHCHRALLALWSEPLRRMLAGGMVEAAQRRITLGNADEEVLEVFLRFLYGLPARCPTGKLVVLCALADQYDVTPLQDATKGAVMEHVVHDPVLCCRAYVDAQMYSIQFLQDQCWRHLVSHLGHLAQEPEEMGRLSLEDMALVLALSGQSLLPPARPMASLAAAVAGVAASTPAGAVQGRPKVLSTFGAPKFNSPFREISELVLFCAAMAWVAADESSRSDERDNMLQRLNFSRMSAADLVVVRDNAIAAQSPLLEELLELAH